MSETVNTATTGVYQEPSTTETRQLWFLNERGGTPDIGIKAVWEDYRGDGVHVAVFDSMVAFEHPDLAGSYDAAMDYDLTNRTADLAYDADAGPTHGTNVAGIIAAPDNGLGTVGVAYEAELSSLAFSYGSETLIDDLAEGFARSEAFDVVNCSWSFVKGFSDLGHAAALVDPVADGRDGNGTVFVFSAGNTNGTKSSNYNAFQNSPLSIAVGAVDQNGDAAYFTSAGSNVLVSAAGVDVRTTHNGHQYTHADGTSFAAPIVSGVVALMLEANADLGYRDVQQILAYSAGTDGLGADPAVGSGWVTNGAANFNGGGLTYNDAFGFGFVDAHAAVRLAETWTEHQTYANRQTVTAETSMPSVTMVSGQNDRIVATIEVNEDIVAEHIQLALDFGWVESGNLEVYLTSPEGTVSQLMYDMPDADRVGGIRNFPFTTVASMGENARGTWTVEIVNANPGATHNNGTPFTGNFRGATLTVHGDALSADDTYVYTDEFAALGLSGDRLTLRDANGGNDTINAAAVTTGGLYDLAGRSAVIAGHAVTIDGAIENVRAGDGNDTLEGDGAGNLLTGGRGDDTFRGLAGDDTVDGGAGTDAMAFGLASSAIRTVEFLADAVRITLDVAGTAIGTFTDVEAYVFTDVTYSLDGLAQWAGGSAGSPDAPLPEEPADEGDPAPEEPSDLPADEPEGEPVEEPVDEPDQPDGGQDAGTTVPEMPAPPQDGIEGTEGADTLKGTGGDDVIASGGGDDAINARAGSDTVSGGSGDDKIFAYGDNDMLFGDAGNDSLFGGSGDDTLVGGEGADMLKGNEGADLFVIETDAAFSLDTIGDFSVAEGDVIDLRALGAAGYDVDVATDGIQVSVSIDVDDLSVEILSARLMDEPGTITSPSDLFMADAILI